MNIKKYFFQYILFISIAFSNCSLDPEVTPDYIFSDEFDNSNQWNLIADTIFFDPIFNPPYKVQVANIENGYLNLISSQSTQCGKAYAIHTMNLTNLNFESKKLYISLNIHSIFKSTFGNVNLILYRNGKAYSESLPFTKEPVILKFVFDGSSLTKFGSGNTYLSSDFRETTHEDGIALIASGCGPDNNHFANLKLDAIYMYLED